MEYKQQLYNLIDNARCECIRAYCMLLFDFFTFSVKKINVKNGVKMSQEELMMMLSKYPLLFETTRDKKMMMVLKEVYTGGKTATELADKYGIEHNVLEQKLILLMSVDVIDMIQEKKRNIYFLGFNGKKFMDLYFESQ